MIDARLRSEVRSWIAGDPHEGDRGELQALLDSDDPADAAALAERFAGSLEFGTAGLRGRLRAGPHGMNLAVIRRTTAGLAHWLRENGGSVVVVGYDARHRSKEFAYDAAATLAGAGLMVRLADRPWPTPLTAFAVRWCDADAGIQITASHNPAPDNGCKVYDGSGAQIAPPDDSHIASAIESQPAANQIPTAVVEPNLGDDLVDAYSAMALSVLDPPRPRALRIVYTPLHGVGGEMMVRLFREAGFADVQVVESQFLPNGDFPGLPFPNPEEPGVLDAAIALASEVDADLIVANDPDADRLAVCVNSPVRGWRMLSGDELGVLLGAHLMARRAGIVARSQVSSRALDATASRLGHESVVTPTGFKWLARAADGREQPLVFAYEEALGYAVAEAVRDKDGLTAALVAADTAAFEAPLVTLARLADQDGLHVTLQWAPRFEGHDGAARMRAATAALGDGDPIEVGFPEGRALVRPSGTEPKLKCYFETVLQLDESTAEAYEHARVGGLAACERMRDSLAKRLGPESRLAS